MSPLAKKQKTRSTAKEERDIKNTDMLSTTPTPAPAVAITLTSTAEQTDAPAASRTSQASSTTALADATLSSSASAPTIIADNSAAAPISDAAKKALERKERFKALQARAKQSQKSNLKEVKAEVSRMSVDKSLLGKLEAKKNKAMEKLEKLDAKDAAEAGISGRDFERKRAWDWTVEESEKWDKRIKKREGHREALKFQDYSAEGSKVYKRQVGNMTTDRATYERSKMQAIERAAASGGLELVETEDGEIVAVDKDGTFYSSADTLGFVENKPPKDAIDRLVKDLQQAEDKRLADKRKRGDKEEGDVTYINEKNKNFNNKLARFYNKYTTEIRESFERGTMI